MSFISMLNINEDRKERNAAKMNDKSISKKDSAYSIYKSLEYVKDNLGQNSFGMQMEIMKNFLR